MDSEINVYNSKNVIPIEIGKAGNACLYNPSRIKVPPSPLRKKKDGKFSILIHFRNKCYTIKIAIKQVIIQMKLLRDARATKTL